MKSILSRRVRDLSHKSIRFYSKQRNVAGTGKILLGHGLFAVGFSGATLIVAAVAEYELARRERVAFYRGKDWSIFKKKMWMGPPGQEEQFTEKMGSWIRSLSPLQKGFMFIIAVNAAVHLVWLRAGSSKPLSQTMYRLFTLRSNSSPVTLITSCFSHQSTLHLLMNMYCLWTFLPLLDRTYGPSCTTALFLTGCVFSSYINLVYKVFTMRGIPTLGASGGIIAAVVAITAAYPHTKLNIMFIPGLSFEASTLMIGFTGLSIVGVAYKRVLPFLDHVAHLGGIVYGYLYYRWIHSSYQAFAPRVKRQWRRFRERK